MPTCDSSHPDPGFESGEDATKVIAEAEAKFGEDGPPGTRCAADPRLGVYQVGGPRKDFPPGLSPSWKFAGSETIDKFEGGRTAIEVGDPDICHPCPTEFKFFVARTLAFTQNGWWIETGWDEQSNLANFRRVYWGEMRPPPYDYSEFIYTNTYPLTDGNYYIFRVRQHGVAGANDASAELWYNGGWNFLHSNNSMKCELSSPVYGAPNCNVQFLGEAYSEYETWFQLNAPVDGAGVNFKDTLLRVNPDVYEVFLQDDFDGSDYVEPPYYPCWTGYDGRKWSKFRAKHASC